MRPRLLGRVAGREVTWVFDPTPSRTRGTVLWVGIVVHRRVLPLAWRIVPQQEPWPEPLGPLLTALLAPIAALPPDCRVTLLDDAGLRGPSFLDTTRHFDGEVLLRVNVSAGQRHRLRLRDARGGRGASRACGPWWARGRRGGRSPPRSSQARAGVPGT